MPKVFLPFLLSLFVIVPVGFFIFSNKHSEENIMGSHSTVDYQDRTGAVVTVASPENIWTMMQYLCKDREECFESATSGVEWGSINGDSKSLTENFIGYSPQWGSYSYIKLYVKPGWGSVGLPYKVSTNTQYTEVETANLKSELDNYEVLIMPLELLKHDVVPAGEFKNHLPFK